MGWKAWLLSLCLCLSVLLARAQRGGVEFGRRWDTVDSLLNRAGQPVEALAEVNRIDALAAHENDRADEVKAIIYRVTIAQDQSPDDTTAIRQLQRLATEASQPARSILQAVLAKELWAYLQRNRSRLYGRTATIIRSNDDISTWTIDDFHRHIRQLFLASLRDGTLLGSTPITDWAPIVIKGNMQRTRPTLFDLLAHEALEYFRSSEPAINQPENVFELNDPAVFADAAAFALHEFVSADSGAAPYQALLLYQRLIRLHLDDRQPEALIDADLDRLNFGRIYSVVPDKDDRYIRALTAVTDHWGANPAAAQAWWLQAKYYSDMAESSKERPDSAGFDGNLRAKAICEKILDEPDSSLGKANCRVLLDEIVRPALDIVSEQFNLPGKPFRCLATWKNLTRVYFRLVRIDTLLGEEGGMTPIEEAWRQWLAMPVFRSFTQDLPPTGDYLSHSAEIPVASLPAGNYLLLASTDQRWDMKTSILAGQTLHVTSMAYLLEGRDYFIVNRETGQPLTDTRAQLWTKAWQGKPGHWALTGSETYHTDQEGHFQLRFNNTNDPRVLELERPGENLFLTDIGVPYTGHFQWMNVTTDKTIYERGNAIVYFFLDRSIYRPGQTVYFKAITITRDFDTRQLKPVSGRHARIRLFNANREQIDSLDVVSDEFGAYHGAFHLPDHGLNGRFQLEDDFGEFHAQGFSVEEYKRPRFYVSFDKLKGGYRVGDSIRVYGHATAYAGNSLDGATVRYRISRLVPIRSHIAFGPKRRIPQERREIGHGELKTGAGGDFTIDFVAAPDRSFPETGDRTFDYQVTADVTDLNGETHSGKTSLTAGYTMLRLGIDLTEREEIPDDSLRSIQVDVSNLSGGKSDAIVRLAAYPLRAPDRLIRERLWETVPDRWVMSEKAFMDSFPHDPYREELNIATWPRGAAAWQAADSTGGHAIPLRLRPGWWAIEATATDPLGGQVRNRVDIDLLDGATGAPADPEYLWSAASEGQLVAPPGTVAHWETGSSAKDVYVIRQVEGPDPTENSYWHREDDAIQPPVFRHFTVNGTRNISDSAIGEKDRGGFLVADAFVKDNRLYVHRMTVRVPWDNKKLDIRYATFRDRTEPGSAERWSMTISGHKAERAATQVLTAMYDASLDEFQPQIWGLPDPFPAVNGNTLWSGINDFGVVRTGYPFTLWQPPARPLAFYDQLMTVGMPPAFREEVYDIAPYRGNRFSPGATPGPMPLRMTNARKLNMAAPEEDRAKESAASPPPPPPPAQVRTNFRETAFFFPDLRTDSAGNVSFSFTMPESLTRWRWMTIADTKDLAFGYAEKTIVTQKQQMVQPNPPRFLREGDKINLAVKVVNLTDSEMTGQMSLALTDPTTGQTADGWFVNRQPNQYFTVPARGSFVVDFPLDIPYQYNRPLTYRVEAQAGKYSDGEEATLPVVSDRMMVTETLPIDMPSDGTRSFTFEKLLQSGRSETLNHHLLTVEFTANPAWYAVQALPYLMESPYECAEQTFDRLYANALAAKIVRNSPRMWQIIEKWRTADTSALLSNLEKDGELKSVLLEETPWVLEGKTESQQKKNIAMLFDTARMSREMEATVGQLADMQASDGSFPWFKGGPDDRWVTQYVLAGIGRLQRLQAFPAALQARVGKIVAAALPYVDYRIRDDYERDRRLSGGVRQIGATAAQYLYMRSFFAGQGIPGDVFSAVNFYRKLAQQDWAKADKLVKGMVALALFRTGDVETAKQILVSLRETAIRDPELGMYWKGMEGGYYWWQAPVETESLLIETFREIGADPSADRAMKTWLLRQKQTHHWPTTRSTADAIYALLPGGQDWLTQERRITVKLGDKSLDLTAGEAGTGYNKKVVDAPFIDSTMGNISVTMKTADGGSDKSDGGSPAWGAVYWQYFDQLDQITAARAGGARAPLRITKRLFIQRNTDRGPVLDTVPENGTLHVGDRVVVRIVLRSDRDLEYVHVKDMRASCLEPTNALSGYRWQGGLGYYESMKDASTDFFFPSVPRGTYVFDYPLVVEQTGEFSDGLATAECMYAPEFADHTGGIRINVEGEQ